MEFSSFLRRWRSAFYCSKSALPCKAARYGGAGKFGHKRGGVWCGKWGAIIYGTSGAIPQSAALTAPNRCPSPLSLRAPARTRAPQQSPGLLLPWRVALFESRNIIEQKKQGKKPCFLYWSGLRDSNSLPPPWQGGALPDELNPQTIVLLYPAGAGLSSPFFAGGNKKCRPLVGITIGTTTYR